MQTDNGLLQGADLHGPHVELNKDHLYHSTFVCPVSKERTTLRNPPVMLKCGHVISKVRARPRVSLASMFEPQLCSRAQPRGDVVICALLRPTGGHAQHLPDWTTQPAKVQVPHLS